MNEAIPAATWVAAALKLPAETWELLFELLLQDLPAENDPEIEAAWLAEVERRMRRPTRPGSYRRTRSSREFARP